MMRIGFKSS